MPLFESEMCNGALELAEHYTIGHVVETLEESAKLRQVNTQRKDVLQHKEIVTVCSQE